MYLPIPLKSLYETPEFKPERYLTHAQRLVQSQVEKMSKMLPDSNSSLWDLYYDHVPSTNPSDWVPPYDGSFANTDTFSDCVCLSLLRYPLCELLVFFYFTTVTKTYKIHYLIKLITKLAERSG